MARATSGGTGTWWRPSCVSGGTTWWRRIFRAMTTRLGSRSTRTPWWMSSRTRADLVVVAQSLGGFTAPLVCERVPVKLLVLVAPMIPAPGEAPADYWANTSYGEEAQEWYEDDIALFYQDVPPELASEALERSRRQSEARMGEPSPLAAWPDVPTRVLLCRDDRPLPAAFVRRFVQERLGITADEIDGGHSPALSRPKELAERLEAYAAEASVNGG